MTFAKSESQGIKNTEKKLDLGDKIYKTKLV